MSERLAQLEKLLAEYGRHVEDSRNKIEMKEQSQKMWTLRELFSDLRKAEVIEVIEYNHGFAPKKGGESARLDLLVDFALFGVPERCPKCGHSGTVHYRYGEGVGG